MSRIKKVKSAYNTIKELSLKMAKMNPEDVERIEDYHLLLQDIEDIEVFAEYEAERRLGADIDPLGKAALEFFRVYKNISKDNLEKALKEIGEEELVRRYSMRIEEAIERQPLIVEAFCRSIKNTLCGYSEERIEKDIRTILNGE